MQRESNLNDGRSWSLANNLLFFPIIGWIIWIIIFAVNDSPKTMDHLTQRIILKDTPSQDMINGTISKEICNIAESSSRENILRKDTPATVPAPSSRINQQVQNFPTRTPIERHIADLRLDAAKRMEHGKKILQRPPAELTFEDMMEGLAVVAELKDLRKALQNFGAKFEAMSVLEKLESNLKVKQQELDIKFAESMIRKADSFCKNTQNIPDRRDRLKFFQDLKELNDDLLKKYDYSALKRAIRDVEGIVTQTQKN